MVALQTRFDGERIIVPDELRGTPPADVIVVVERAAPAGANRPSVFDAIGKAPHPRSAGDIDAQVRAERDGWGDR